MPRKIKKKVGREESKGKCNKKNTKQSEKLGDKSCSEQSENAVTEQSTENENKIRILEAIVAFGTELNKNLSDISELVTDILGNAGEGRTGDSSDSVGGGTDVIVTGAEREILKALQGSVEGSVQGIRKNWEGLGKVVEEATRNLEMLEWESVSIDEFSGFEVSDIIENEEGEVGEDKDGVNRSESKESGGGQGNMTFELVEEDNENEGDNRIEESGKGYSIEEGFARIEKSFEEKLGRELKRLETRMADCWGYTARGGEGWGGRNGGRRIGINKGGGGEGKGWGVRRGKDRGRRYWGEQSWEGGRGQGSRWKDWVMLEDIEQGVRGDRGWGWDSHDQDINEVDWAMMNNSDGGSRWRGNNQKYGVIGKSYAGEEKWRARLFSGFGKDISVDDIAGEVKKFGKDCIVMHIGTMHEELYSTFVIQYRAVDMGIFEGGDIWGRGIRSKEFVGRPRYIVDERRIFGSKGVGPGK